MTPPTRWWAGRAPPLWRGRSRTSRSGKRCAGGGDPGRARGCGPRKQGPTWESAVKGLRMCAHPPRPPGCLLRTPPLTPHSSAPSPVTCAPTAPRPQVRFSYSNGNARNDHALQHYGFVNRDRAADPLLCCVDEPGGDLWTCPDPGAGLLARAEAMNERGGLSWGRGGYAPAAPHAAPPLLRTLRRPHADMSAHTPSHSRRRTRGGGPAAGAYLGCDAVDRGRR